MKKLGQYLLTALFIGFIITIGMSFWMNPDKAISFNENRSLAQKPVVTTDAIIDGSFTKAYESYFTDQFPERDRWVEGYLDWQQLTNQTFLFDYFVSEDDEWIFPKPMDYFADDNIDRSIAYMHELTDYAQKNEIELFFFSLPERTISLKAPFPFYIKEGYEQANKDYFLDGLPKQGLTVVNMGGLFQNKFSQDELKDLYFQTDHHWNANGAFEGYKIIYDVLNKQSRHFNEPAFRSDIYESQCFPEENFLGSYNKQLYGMVNTTDVPCIITPTTLDYHDLEVYAGPVRDDLKVPYDSIYGRDLNKKLDWLEYAGLFTGDYRELNIINPHKKAADTKVLVLKDSYANPLTLWVSQHFYQTTYYDMRYNTDRTLYEFIEQNDYDTIIFLYNDLTVFSSMYDFHLSEK